jgi:hypothetical protein
MGYSIAALLGLLVAAFTIQYWIWKFGCYREIKASIEVLELAVINVSFFGKYGIFARSSVNNGFITAFHKTKWLKERVGEGLNDLMKVCVVAAIAQIILFAVAIMGAAEHSNAEETSKTLYFFPWSELISLFFFVLFTLNIRSEWERVKEELPS